MSVYTVHEPPLKAGEAGANPERFAFVRDGFHFWAMVFGPFWMAWRRLWLVLVLFIVLAACLWIALRFANVGATAQAAIVTLLALLIGFEAGSLRRWTLRRRGWREVAAVVGDDAESAERRFFSAWIENRAAPKPQSVTPVSPLTRGPRASAPDVVGLFPEPGGQR